MQTTGSARTKGNRSYPTVIRNMNVFHGIYEVFHTGKGVAKDKGKDEKIRYFPSCLQ